MEPITVERTNIAPVIRYEEKYDTLIADVVLFTASCGCGCAMGMRLDNDETTCGYIPCEQHRPLAEDFMARFIGPDTPAIDTEVWMGQLLTRLLEEARGEQTGTQP